MAGKERRESLFMLSKPRLNMIVLCLLFPVALLGAGPGLLACGSYPVVSDNAADQTPKTETVATTTSAASASSTAGGEVSLFPVQIDGLSGYIDETGKMAISPQYLEAGDFSEGLASVVCPDGTSGYIDRSGSIVLQIPDGYLGTFHDGLAAIQWGEMWGYVDKSGKVVIEPRFLGAGGFHEGLAAASLDGDQWGFIDKTGQFAIPPQFEWVGDFSEGLAAFEAAGAADHDLQGYIDGVGKVAIAPQFLGAGELDKVSLQYRLPARPSGASSLPRASWSSQLGSIARRYSLTGSQPYPMVRPRAI